MLKFEIAADDVHLKQKEERQKPASAEIRSSLYNFNILYRAITITTQIVVVDTFISLTSYGNAFTVYSCKNTVSTAYHLSVFYCCRTFSIFHLAAVEFFCGRHTTVFAVFLFWSVQEHKSSEHNNRRTFVPVLMLIGLFQDYRKSRLCRYTKHEFIACITI